MIIVNDICNCDFMLIFMLMTLIMGMVHSDDTQIIHYENIRDERGNYKFSYELTDGTRRDEEGTIKNPGTANEILSVKGSYSWKDPSGIEWIVTFVADENGYQPKVDKISFPPLGAALPPSLIGSLLG